MKRKLTLFSLSLMMIVGVSVLFFHGVVDASGEGKLVYVVPLEDEVERGLEAFLTRATEEAIANKADHIIFEINTPGGVVNAASNIGELLSGIDIPTTAYITNRALSAGSYIALFADNIYMSPQATMGASGIITGDGNAADDKAQSYWLEAMGSAAESKGRDRIYAEAMADASIDLPEYNAPTGSYLTLGPTAALEVGYSEGTVNHRTELLAELDLTGAEIVEVEVTLAENVARFLTNSVVISILLSLAGLGLIVELYSPGFGVAGSTGVIALILFFYGHTVAGLAGYEVFVLLIIGVALVVTEFFVPGGILGGIGTLSIIASLFIASGNVAAMSFSILIAMVVSLTAAVILYKRIGLQKGLLRYIILSDQETTERGYVSNLERKDLAGQVGVTLTPLRPAGTARFNDERVDVVSEGGFISRDQPVMIVKVAGGRIIVREQETKEE